MSNSHSPESAGEQERIVALFANLVLQQTNLALMMLGRAPNPETGQTVQDLDGARYFIDQLEMLEVKTKGNLSPREDQLLKQSLMTLRMAFVEASEATPGTATADSAPRPGQGQPAPSAEAAPGTATATPAAGEEEPRKKYSKKY